MKRLCIVEDDQALLEIYRMIFSDADFNVATAKNGEEGFKVIKKSRPDLALIDLMMPFVDGVELITKLRQQVWAKDLKIIVLTNIGRTETTVNLAELGVLEVVTKVDIAPADLVSLVQSHL